MAHYCAALDASRCPLIITMGYGGKNVKNRATFGTDKMLMVLGHPVEPGNGRSLHSDLTKFPFFY